MLKFNFKNHIFKFAGAAAGLLSGLGLFGLIFGIIAGAFLDQLMGALKQRRRLKIFIENPALCCERNQIFIETAAIMISWHFCRKDAAKRALLGSVSQQYYHRAPQHIIEILSEKGQAGTDVNTEGAAEYFGGYAEEEQKKKLAELLTACGLKLKPASPDGEAILSSAGLDGFIFPGPEHSRLADYEILGLGPEATSDEIKHIYHQLASQFHPDGNRHLSSAQQKITEEAFIRIKEAYERLIN